MTSGGTEKGSITLLHAVTQGSGLSRRKAFAAIREGRVEVDGEVVPEPSAPYSGGALRLDGKALQAKAPAKVYLMLNKPPGFITTNADERGRRTVLDLLPDEMKVAGLHPVGRLDRDTSGLLLLTNDGDLTYALTHPKHEVEKEYWVRLASVDEGAIAALRRGVEIDGEIRRVVRLRRLDEGQFQLSITIGEGRNRQVRRMMESAGLRVTALRRVREGPLDLGSLPEGAVRELTKAEVEALRTEAGRLTGGGKRA